jgi:hypothetical protein
MATVGSYAAEAHIGLQSQSFDSHTLRRSPGFAASVKWRDWSRFSERVLWRNPESGDRRQLRLETGDCSARRRRVGDSNPARAMAVAEKKPGRFYFNVTGFPFPLGPFLQRRTIRKEVRSGFCNPWFWKILLGKFFGCSCSHAWGVVMVCR